MEIGPAAVVRFTWVPYLKFSNAVVVRYFFHFVYISLHRFYCAILTPCLLLLHFPRTILGSHGSRTNFGEFTWQPRLNSWLQRSCLHIIQIDIAHCKCLPCPRLSDAISLHSSGRLLTIPRESALLAWRAISIYLTMIYGVCRWSTMHHW